MPLNGEQQRTIEGTISHLLDFSVDPNQFIIEEAQLVDAIPTKNSINSMAKDHAFYWLRECLLNPSNHFQNLLKLGPEVTVGEIQQYIIDMIDFYLIKTNHALLIWNKDSILAGLPKHNWNTIFSPEKAPEDGWDNPWQLPKLENQIYTQELRIQTNTNYIETEEEPLSIVTKNAYVDVTIKLSNKTIHESIQLWEITEHFHDDDDENRYIEKLNLYAARKAKNKAALIAIQELSIKQMTPEKITRLAKRTDATKTIVTHEFYYQLLDQKLLPLSEIVNLSHLEAVNLCHPSLISLGKKNYLTIEEIKNLSSAERKVIVHPLYYSFFEKKLILLQDIKNITDKHSTFIIHPRITSLIQRQKISFHQAFALPNYLKDVLLCDLYVTFFINHEIDWYSFSKIKQGHHLVLLNKNIARFINNEILTFKVIVKLLEESVDPQITLFNCYINIFSIRLYELINKKPFTLDSKIDHFQDLLNEIMLSAHEIECELYIFKECIIEEIITHIKADIEHRRENAQKKQLETMVYENILKIITPVAILPGNWSQVLHMLIEHCKILLRTNRYKNYPEDKSFQAKNNMFHKVCKRKNNELIRSTKKLKKNDLADVLNMCTSIIELSPLENLDKTVSVNKYLI